MCSLSAFGRRWLPGFPTVLLICWASSMATAEPTPGQDAARQAYLRCLQDEAGQLDDGGPDVTGVALAVKSACTSSFVSFINYFTDKLSPGALEVMRSRLEQERLSEAALAVMRTRAVRAKSLPSPSAAQPPATSEGNTGSDGMAAYERGDFVRALAIFRPLAESGDNHASVMLGLMYSEGNGVAKDVAEAQKLYQRAAERANAVAQYLLGRLYADIDGVHRDDAEALKWFRKAAEQDYRDAQHDLGVMLMSGRGAEKDPIQAAKWFLKAAESGDSNAQRRLGAMYATGSGVPKNPVLKGKWFRKAADQGDAMSQYLLSLEYSDGTEVPQNFVLAYKWADLAASSYPTSDVKGRTSALEIRRVAASRLTPKQITDAQALVSQWRSASVEMRAMLP